MTAVYNEKHKKPINIKRGVTRSVARRIQDMTQIFSVDSSSVPKTTGHSCKNAYYLKNMHTLLERLKLTASYACSKYIPHHILRHQTFQNFLSTAMVLSIC
jgi:hypothetical protein